jgi:hypothetical protein
MAVLSTPSKGKLGVKAAKTAVKHPARTGKALKPAAKIGIRVSKPLVKRRARNRARGAGEAARTVGETLRTYGVPAAYQLGLIELPKQKRTAPRVAVGVLLGAVAVYFLDPQQGSERRQKVAQMMG